MGTVRLSLSLSLSLKSRAQALSLSLSLALSLSLFSLPLSSLPLAVFPSLTLFPVFTFFPHTHPILSLSPQNGTFDLNEWNLFLPPNSVGAPRSLLFLIFTKPNTFQKQPLPTTSETTFGKKLENPLLWE